MAQQQQQQVQVLLLLVQVIYIIMSAQVSKASYVTCYYCTDYDPSSKNYDPSCGDYNYAGQSGTWTNADGCSISIHKDGTVDRYGGYSAEDGYCSDDPGVYGPGFTRCFCKGDKCNTNSMCEQCHTTTTETTTTTTTTLPTTTTTQTTTNPPHTTMDTTTETTTVKATTTTTDAATVPTSPTTSTTSTPQLGCYSCFDCSVVDESTPIIVQDFMLCTTTGLLNTQQIIRGGTSHNDHTDGECEYFDESITCWCSGNLCNHQQIDF